MKMKSMKLILIIGCLTTISAAKAAEHWGTDPVWWAIIRLLPEQTLEVIQYLYDLGKKPLILKPVIDELQSAIATGKHLVDAISAAKVNILELLDEEPELWNSIPLPAAARNAYAAALQSAQQHRFISGGKFATGSNVAHN